MNLDKLNEVHTEREEEERTGGTKPKGPFPKPCVHPGDVRDPDTGQCAPPRSRRRETPYTGLGGEDREHLYREGAQQALEEVTATPSPDDPQSAARQSQAQATGRYKQPRPAKDIKAAAAAAGTDSTTGGVNFETWIGANRMEQAGVPAGTLKMIFNKAAAESKLAQTADPQQSLRARAAGALGLEETQELYEMCPDGPHTEPEGEMVGGIEGEMEGEMEGDVESLATKALQAIADLAAAAGADVSTRLVPTEEEEELEERRGRGRADPRNQRGPPDPRQRPMAEERVRNAFKGKKITEKQLQQIVNKVLEFRRVLESQQERKSNKR